MPVAFWVEPVPTREFVRSVTGCQCELGWFVLDSPENRAVHRKLMDSGAVTQDHSDPGDVFCACYGRLIE